MVLPEIVYHYTSAETLLKITKAVGHECLWATNARYLNDITETEYCLNMLRERLPAFKQTNKRGDVSELETVLFDLAARFWKAPYVTSFSIYRDSLPQWRSYCANGNGVSIGFRTSALNKCRVKSNFQSQVSLSLNCRLEPVRYLKPNDWEMVDSMILESLSELDEWHEEQDQLPVDERDSIPNELVLETIISSKACLTKHAAFESEQEFRLVAPSYVLGGDLQFRTSRTTVIPYYEVMLPAWGISVAKSPKYTHLFDDYFISEVVVGPTPNPDLTADSLRQMFLGKSVTVSVEKSSVPYRDL